MNTKRVIFVGDSSHHEFRDPIAWMREYCDLTVCRSLASVTGQLAGWQDSPSAIVLGQPRPAAVEQIEIERLRSKGWPTTLIALMGGWCEGEVRTGQPLRDITRVAWQRFIPQIGPWLQRGATSDGVPGQHAGSGLVIVRSTSRESYAALADACNAIGYSTVWLPRARAVLATRAVFGMWDCQNNVHDHVEELREFACQVHPAPVIALLGFPRRDDCAAALCNGATTVLSKPYLESELCATLADASSFARRAA